MEWTYNSRIETLRATKLKNTAEKQRVIGDMDYDDWGIILPPEHLRKLIKTMSGSGVEINDIILNSFEPESNHETGTFFGPLFTGKNFGALMKCHPPCVDPYSSLLGGYMVNFGSYKKMIWNPDYDFSHLHAEQEKYGLIHGIGGVQHFCHDLSIGLDLGFAGLLRKVREYRSINGAEKYDFYDGLEHVLLGLMDWIGRTCDEAERLASQETSAEIKTNLLEMADINRRLLESPPNSFREACQFTLWYQVMARMFNGNGALGRLDQLLYKYYKKDKDMGILTDEESAFHIICCLLATSDYAQIGGYTGDGNDSCNELSFIVLDAMEKMKVPYNIGVCSGAGLDDALLRRGVEIAIEGKHGNPKFLGPDGLISGFVKNGYPLSLARQRAYSGCHWFALPGIEYTLGDLIKVNFVKVFTVAFDEMMEDKTTPPSIERLWELFHAHIIKVVELTAKGVDFHIEHMGKVYPELVLDLCCVGPVERGLDASEFGGVDYYNIMVDGSGLATVADSFGAIAEVICSDKRFGFHELHEYMKSDWTGSEAEIGRMYMKRAKRFGYGGSKADEYAERISEMFADECAALKTPKYGITLISGLFSWALNIHMGKGIGATPNGRRRDEGISHGANPNPGFREDGAATAMVKAVGRVQHGYGNSSPLQLDLDGGIVNESSGVEIVMNLIKTHFELGGTQINLNITDRKKLLEAYDHPEKHPELIVRITGFSAYFGSLSKDMRKFVIERTVGNTGETEVINA